MIKLIQLQLFIADSVGDLFQTQKCWLVMIFTDE